MPSNFNLPPKATRHDYPSPNNFNKPPRGGGDPEPPDLDYLPAGGARAVWSLRQALEGYTGPAITIRRVSDGQTQEIGFTANHLSTPDIVSFCSGTTGTVSIWHDQTGNGRDLLQDDAAAQPIIYQGGQVITLGVPDRPALLFDEAQFFYRNEQFFDIQDGVTLSVVLASVDPITADFSPVLWAQSMSNIGERAKIIVSSSLITPDFDPDFFVHGSCLIRRADDVVMLDHALMNFGVFDGIHTTCGQEFRDLGDGTGETQQYNFGVGGITRTYNNNNLPNNFQVFGFGAVVRDQGTFIVGEWGGRIQEAAFYDHPAVTEGELSQPQRDYWIT